LKFFNCLETLRSGLSVVLAALYVEDHDTATMKIELERAPHAMPTKRTRSSFGNKRYQCWHSGILIQPENYLEEGHKIINTN
jgi:hypothetical protein